MISLIQSIVTMFVSLLSFVVNTFVSLIFLIGRIPTLISILLTSISIVPDVIMPFATASVSIFVVLFVLGRNK